jgi:CRP-like cAMP-binding protein
LNCLKAQSESFGKDSFIIDRGQKVSFIGIVMCGSVHIIKEDFWGNRTIVGTAFSGEIFAETYACCGCPAEVSVVAAEKTQVLFVDADRILHSCENSCSFHERIIENLLQITAGKNLALTRKMEHMSRRSTREKLLSYLSSQAIKAGGADFEIPLNRQQLADYLAVERSAMCSELSKLKNDGLISYNKNKFRLENYSNEEFAE